MAGAAVTRKVLVTSGAGIQVSLPAWKAVMETVPVPVKVRLVPPARAAGPPATAKPGCSPLEAVADSPTLFVAH